jgi:hypothetical protein
MPRIRYDWAKVQKFYDMGHSVKECYKKFGFWPVSWEKAVNRGVIKPRPRKKPLSYYLVKGKTCNTTKLKKRLIEEGLLKDECSMLNCPSTSTWLGKPLVLQLDHIDGDEANNLLENLRILCPNCHSQTPTYGSKNWKTKNTADNKEIL